ncbi:alpha/beta hydrolase [Solwaraspora sp. WMMB762]|uniref:alpha/beta hydrolase n=1 Tax=Solwaraspora sp. WMMB762 TaxID=3404120 RepID=UPI003B95077F
MALDPQSAAAVTAAARRMPALGTEVYDAAEARRILATRPGNPPPGPPVHRVAEHRAGPAGPRVRVYHPAPTGRPQPAVVFCHGGGFTFCSLDTHDGLCRLMARDSGAVVVSVDYRLAPEHRFPAAAEDAYAATAWTADNAAALGVDPARIAVAGDSAGGNLAAVTAQLAVARGGPALAYQLLVYPMLDHRFDTDSYRSNGHGYAVTVDHLRWYWHQYLGDADPDQPAACPLRAGDLAGLPPTYLVTAEHCPLRSENEAYAARLRAAGVAVTLASHPGVVHGFFTQWHQLDTGRTATAQAFAVLRAVLDG